MTRNRQCLLTGAGLTTLAAVVAGVALARAMHVRTTVRLVEQLEGGCSVRMSCPEWAEDMLGDMSFAFAAIDRVHFAGQVDDAALQKVLAATSSIEALTISNCTLTTNSVRAIRDCNRLRILNLSHTNLTDAGLCEISTLPHLEYLHVNGTLITRGGLQCIVTSDTLRVLGLGDTALTDEDVILLGQFSRLEEVDVSGTRITEEGIRELSMLTSARVIDAGVAQQ